MKLSIKISSSVLLCSFLILMFNYLAYIDRRTEKHELAREKQELACENAEAINQEVLDLLSGEKNSFSTRTIYNVSDKEELKRLRIASQKIEKAITSCPNEGSFELRGIIKANYGELEKSIKDFEIAIRLNPEYCWPYSDLAGVLSELKRYKESDANYSIAIEKCPKDPRVLRNYAIFLNKIGKSVDSQKYFSRANVLNKKYPTN